MCVRERRGRERESTGIMCVFNTHNRPNAMMKTHPESKCPELLANYCDMLLRKTPLSKKLTPEETEAKLKDVVRMSLVMIVCVCVLVWAMHCDAKYM